MFKRCTMCKKTWEERDAFLADPEINIIGYQVNFEELQLGYFLFNHMTCQTTLAIHAAHFVDFYRGPVYAERKTGTAECNQHCLQKNDLDLCAAKCECAYVREIIQMVREWPTANDQAAGSRSALSA